MIKRYDLINVPCHGGYDSYDELQEVEDGGWVRYDDHAAEVERLRAENERLRAKLEDTDRIGRDALRKGGHPAPDDWNAAYAIGWLEARNDREFRVTQAQREAAIYGAVYANAYPHVSTRVAMSHAEDAVEAWRAAQKGGSDG